MREIITLLLLTASQLKAGAEGVGTTSANFLKIPTEARPAAMGEAFVALSDDESALTYNPAGVGKLLQNQVSATHIEWFQGIKLEHMGGVFSLGEAGSLGAALTWLQVDDLIRTARVANSPNPLANYVELGTFAPHDMAFTGTYARNLGHSVSVGLSLRLLNQNIDTKNGWGGSVDLGGQYLGLLQGLDLGFVLRNLGSSITLGTISYQLPLDFMGGLLYRIPSLPIAVTADVGSPVDNIMMWGVGVEGWIYDLMALRGGYRGGFGNQLTAGAGFRMSGFQLDYAWVPFNELGQTHRVTASYNFGTPPIGMGLERPLIGPVGDLDKRETAWLPRLQQQGRIREWVLSIRDGAGNLVSEQGGQGPPPARLLFNGRDTKGLPLPDQQVSAELEARYDSGVSARAQGPSVELDSTPPQLTLDITPKIHRPSGDAVMIPATFSMTATDKNGVNGWGLEIRDSDGALIRSTNGLGELPRALVWDGNDNLGQPIKTGHTYIGKVFARDRLGNKGESQPVAEVVLLKEVHFVMASDALFEVGKSDVRISAFQQMKEMKAKIEQYLSPGGTVEIVGHTDSAGTPEGNQKLSVDRAQAVVKFFVTLLNMDEKMFKATGRGDTQPVATNDTPEGREKNRRVEIQVHGITYK